MKHFGTIHRLQSCLSAQKASVKGIVGKIATAIIAKLRDELFYSFEDLKLVITNEP